MFAVMIATVIVELSVDGVKVKLVPKLQSISLAARLTVELTKFALFVRVLIVRWVVAWFALMLGGRIISSVKARLNAMITIRALVFLLDRFLVALVSVPIFLSPDYAYYRVW
jgi:hypothetical protein